MARGLLLAFGVSDPFKIGKRRSEAMVSSRTADEPAIAEAAGNDPVGEIPFETERAEPWTPPPPIALELTQTSNVAAPQPAGLPDFMRDAYAIFRRAGVSDFDALGLVFGGATCEDAKALAEQLLSSRTALADFGPKAIAISVLSAIASAQEVNGRDLRALVEAHRHLTVVRPDGYLAHAFSGEAIERTPMLKAGELYALEQGLVYELDEQLLRVENRPPLFELSLDRMVYGHFLDGAENAMRTAIKSAGDLISDPPAVLAEMIGSLAELDELIVATPELIDRFAAMSRGDQIEALSNLATTLALARCAARFGAGGSAGNAGALVISVSERGELALRVALNLAPARALAGAGAGLGIAMGALPELSPIAEASMKRAAKLLSNEAAIEKRKMLPKLAAERERLMAKLDELLENPNLSERTRANLDAARNGLSDHLKPEDLTGALRDNLELPVRKPGSGRVYLHDEEVESAMQALREARKSLVYEFQRAVKRGDAASDLSKSADELLDFHNAVDTFKTP